MADQEDHDASRTRVGSEETTAGELGASASSDTVADSAPGSPVRDDSASAGYAPPSSTSDSSQKRASGDPVESTSGTAAGVEPEQGISATADSEATGGDTGVDTAPQATQQQENAGTSLDQPSQ